ncbi:glutaredoxin family protein [Thermostichus vulcanus]|uniref:Glutaredoxin family protein n=1 Tax=Thermostichus vulcanus str. 'Rupite' TaxID=2813851 RepID=A0ABT0C876_THEVL|nr:glutaredoxin family protein [Thermostichus vulcanus]MCJ2541998.1 glutaredoxin family protein [Thermostichus vulcanus str. 'Rupite']
MIGTLAWPPLILYSKPGCHLCEGLAEKLWQIPEIPALEIRDITTNSTWWERYQLEIPVLSLAMDPERPLPQPSPRLTVQQLRTWLEKQLTSCQY